MKKKNYFLNKTKFTLISLCLWTFISMQAQTADTPDGFGANATGGGNASSIAVSNESQIRSAVKSNSSKVVIVTADIDLGSSSLPLGANTTLIGNGSGHTITGNVRVSNVENVIIQNLIFNNKSAIGTGDGIEVSGSTNVFITKCTFVDCADGSVDIVRASDFVTVSYCRFTYPTRTSHNFPNLIGNGDGVTTDAGKLHCTLHHNWYDYGCQSRMPRVRYGEVHVYNNYYSSNDDNYNIGVGYKCNIYAESCYFENQGSAFANYGEGTGKASYANFKLVNSSISYNPPASSFKPPYSSNIDPVNNVKSIVMASAGAGASGQATTTYSLSSSVNGQGSISPSNGTYNEGSLVTLTATPVNGWQFDNWSDDVSGTSNPLTITMSSNKTVTANFSPSSSSIIITIQENETGFCSVDGAIDNNNSGFTGAGFANTTNASGQGITWSVNVSTSGNYNLVWRYANGGSTDRTAKLMVDGATVVSNVSMPSTGSWTIWEETSAVSVYLSAGTKLLRLQATNSSGLVNIDYVSISGENLNPATCSGLKSAEVSARMDNNKADLDVKCYPVPVDNLLNIEFSREFKGTVHIYLYDVTGKTVKHNKGNGSSHILDMTDLPQGFYTIKISGKNLNRVERIIKQ